MTSMLCERPDFTTEFCGFLKPGYEGVDAVADKNPVQITVSRNHTALSMTAIKEAIQVRAVWNSTIYSDGLHSLTLSA